MKYLEWNNLISNYFFNAENAGKDVYLYITKKDIILLAKNNFNEETEEEIWADFLNKIKCGIPGSIGYPDIVDKATYAFKKWQCGGLKSVDGIELKHPTYICYLTFFVLPLIEIQGDYNANNYYDRLDDFLEENNIKQNLRGKLKDIDCLWADLSYWTKNIKNGELGSFKTIEFKTWKYVGKPFYQCVLPPKAIRKLPEFFSCCGLTPKTFYQYEIFKDNLEKNGQTKLGLKPSVIDLIKKGRNDEIGNSIIVTVKKEFNDWTGEEHEIVLKDGTEKNIRKNTVVPLKLQFKIDEDEKIEFSYRVRYSTEPPTDLKFEEFEDIYENENWSRTLRKPYKESFEIKDSFNKWKAVFDFKSIRLLIRGGYFQLGNDFWIETETLSRVESMYLLCKNEIKDSIKEWGERSCSIFRDDSFFSNLPTGYSLFWLKNPKESHEEYQQLRVSKNKKIFLREYTGLKIGYRTYLNQILPEVEISNAEGSEIVYIQYDGSENRIYLQKSSNLGGVWLLPENILIKTSFCIEIENESIDGNKQSYKIDEASFKNLSNDILVTRNKFNVEVDDSTEFIQGNQIKYLGTFNSIVDEQSFCPNTKAIIKQEENLNFKENTLLKWLVGIKLFDIAKYKETFEIVLHNSFSGEQFRVQERMKSSLNILDYLGYIDFNYDSGKIYTLPPKLITVPCKSGRKALLIGGRDEKLINEMIDYCSKSNDKISLLVKKQSIKNQQMLIPDSIIFESNSRSEFEKLATYFDIEFDKWYILKLKKLIPTLNEYEQFTIANGSSESWERFGLEKKVFKKESLKFENVEIFDKEYSLTECRPNYNIEYGLWINNLYFIVDKNWGKYLFINHCSEKIRGYGSGNYFAKPFEIFCNSNNLAIPASLSLPKLFLRIMLQLSGEAPEFKQLDIKGQKVWYNVFRNIPSLFIDNFFKFKLNMIIETTNQGL